MTRLGKDALTEGRLAVGATVFGAAPEFKPPWEARCWLIGPGSVRGDEPLALLALVASSASGDVRASPFGPADIA